MSTKSVFRLSTQSNKYKEPLYNTLPQRPNMNDSVFSVVDTSSVRNSPQFLWQSLTPELRAEALRRAHLIHLLRQVNPNLQLCRKNSSNQLHVSTAEKGVQVPDIRFDMASNRRFSVRGDPKRNASFTAPGVRIQPRNIQQHSQTLPIRPRTPIAITAPRDNVLKPNYSMNITRPLPKRIPFKTKENTIQVTVTTIPRSNEGQHKPTIEEPPKAKEIEEKIEQIVEKMEEKITLLEKENQDSENIIIIEDENDPKSNAPKTERQVVLKTKEASSGDEDSVVVVLNQPRTEQGLERKYGQFFCRRCLRGWSSRSVWCVRHTCKVYIKQTCNACNKLVNPYLVCRLPPVTGARK